jgi:hypothetical protein
LPSRFDFSQEKLAIDRIASFGQLLRGLNLLWVNSAGKSMKLVKCKTFLAAAVALATALNVNAAETTATSPALGALSAVGSAELPSKAAELVTQANPKNLKSATMDVVKAAVGLNPAAAPAIVGSIAHASPDMAATAAATAATLVPDQVLIIAKAAAAAAPAKAGEIVEALCRVLPADYRVVAEAAADVVPGAGREILAGVAAAVPQLKDAINQTLASYQGSVPSVSSALSQVAQTAGASAVTTVAVGTGSTGSPTPQGPSPGTPPTPPSGTPVVLTPGSGGVIPSGPRGYSAP